MTVSSRERPCFDFSQSDYRALLRGFRELGYEPVGLEQIDNSRRHLFLRHDVDMCLDRAATIAAIEHEERMAATYYVLVSTSAYNLASAESRRRLSEIVAFGHSIGLHFDATAFPGAGAEELEARAKEECSILESLAGAPVKSISFHRPAPALLGWQGAFAGRAHTYERRFTQDIGYVSDSSGGFFHGHPLDHPAVKAGTAIQVLTHPIWWHSTEPRSASELIEELRKERADVLDRILTAATAKAKTRAMASDN